MTIFAAKPMRVRGLDFPVALFSSGIRQDGRRLFLPLMCVLSLLLTVLVLWGAAEAMRPFQRTGSGIKLLPVITGTVFFGMFVFLGMNIPFALRAATADDDLPLVMLSGLSPHALWRARVCTAALPVLAIPFVHLPLLMFLYTMGGVTLRDFGCVAIFWLAGGLLSVGWSALAGSIWSGAARDRLQGMAITFFFGFLHAMGVGVVARLLAWMNSPWTWWTLQSFQPPWRWTGPEFGRLGAHVLIGGLAAWASVIVLRGRWRSAVEAGSQNVERVPAESLAEVVKRTAKAEPQADDLSEAARQWAPVRPRCGTNPWFWKDFHVSGGSWWYWWGRIATAIALTLVAGFFCAKSASGRYVEPVIVLTMVGWFIWMMFEIGQVLSVEFQDRMWSIIRITPNTVSRILWSKLLAFVWKLVPSFLPLGFVCLFGLTTYAHLVVLIGLPVLMMVSVPIAALILYGSAIPQTLIGAGWPMVKTLVPVGIAIFLAGWVTTYAAEIPREFQPVMFWTMFGFMTIGITFWLYYCTLCELNNPARERLSSDGG